MVGTRFQTCHSESRGSHEQSSVCRVANAGSRTIPQDRIFTMVGMGDYGHGIALQSFPASNGISRGCSPGLLKAWGLSHVDQI